MSDPTRAPTEIADQEPAVAPPGDTLEALRARARVRAAERLAQRGFTPVEGTTDQWSGTLQVEAATVEARVLLPKGFPDHLPKVSVDVESLPHRIAHVENSGNICVAPTSNLLLDADRPDALVDFAVDRATAELVRGFTGVSAPELDLEFMAYWSPTDLQRLVSICDSEGDARPIALAEVTEGPAWFTSAWILADSEAQLQRWVSAMRLEVRPSVSGLFIPLNASVPLPQYDAATTVEEIRSLIAGHATESGKLMFEDALQRGEYPVIVLSLPEAEAGTGRRLIAIRLKPPSAAIRELAGRGFRPGRVPVSRILQLTRRDAVKRFQVERADHEFLTARGGAADELSHAVVAIVGLGAVGSEVARNIVALGVRQLRIVDPDWLSLENVHRHAAGARQVGRNKALVMAEELTRNFPHCEIQSFSKSVEEIILGGPEVLTNADLIIMATGEETLERRVAQLLADGPPRIHTWLEPLGLAGHSLATAVGNIEDGTTPGCYECLFRLDERHGVVNRAALTAPGQEIRQSLAGCAGTFSPFSPIDARRTALDASELAAQVIMGTIGEPTLVTWRGLHTQFEASGFTVSERARSIPPGARVEVCGSEFGRDDCAVCGSRQREPRHRRLTAPEAAR